MSCVGKIDAGGDRAREELLYLSSLLIEFGGGIEQFPNGPVSFGFTDIYRCPALGTDNFIRVQKVSEDGLEHLATLRVLTREVVEYLVQVANRHGESPVPLTWKKIEHGTRRASES